MSKVQPLNVRISEESRRNLVAAAGQFKLGLADLVDRMLARPEAIATAVMAGFEVLAATAPAPKVRRVVRGPQLGLKLAKSKRAASKGGRRGARK